MARHQAPQAQVGQVVVLQCDARLRAALASAIETGDAFICTAQSCMGMARQRAAEQAKSAYRKRLAGWALSPQFSTCERHNMAQARSTAWEHLLHCAAERITFTFVKE